MTALRSGARRLALLAWAAALASCGDSGVREPLTCDAWRPFDPAVDVDYAAYAAHVGRDRCPKPWTVLVYMAADVEDLPPYALADLRELEAAGSSERADVVVQLDLPGPPGLRRYHLFAASAATDSPRSPVVATLPEPAGPPEDALADFIAWGRAHYPSDRVMVVLWGHGQGWRPRTATGERVRHVEGGFAGGFGFDHGQDTVMDIPSLTDALTRGSGGAPIDVLVMDACLMQSVDVAATLAEAARYIVGHEQVDPYGGLAYDAIVPLINGQDAVPQDPACALADEPCQLAAAIPPLMISSTADTFVVSAADGQVLRAALLPALARLSAALVDYIAEDPLRASDLRARLGSRLPGERIPEFSGNTADLGILLTRLRQEVQEEKACTPPCPTITGLLAALDDSERALDAAVIRVSVGPAYASDDAYAWTAGPAGLSVWVPPRSDVFAARRAAFATSPAHDWLPWLEQLVAEPADDR